jgi:hypothetical protein
MDSALFNEFLLFQQFKAAQATLATALPVEDASSVSSSERSFHGFPAPPVRRVNYEKAFECLWRLRPNNMRSKNPMMWKLFQNLRATNPECFKLVGEGHPSPDGRFYFSFTYRNAYTTVNFHVYGLIDRTYFIIQTIDILMSSAEVYRDAADFRAE